MLIDIVRADRLEVFGGEDLYDWREDHKRQVPGAQFTPQFKAGHWDGCWKPGSALRRTSGGYKLECGRGYLERLLVAFPDADISTDRLVIGAAELDFERPEILYDHQEETLDFIHDYPWARFDLATNAGKGAVIALVADAVARAGRKTLILSDEKSVVDALKGEIEEWGNGQAYDTVEAGRKDVPKAQIVVAMVPTLYRRLPSKKREGVEGWPEWLSTFDTVLFDEADKATSDSWQIVIQYLTNTTRRYGFSGTFPDESSLDDLVLEEMMGPSISSVRNIELVEKGISAKPRVILHPWSSSIPRLPYDQWKYMSGPERRRFVYEHAVITNQERHLLVRSLIEPGVPNAVIVNLIAHGEELEKVIPNSVFIDGSVSDGRRIELLEEFEEGEYETIIVTKILDRGSNRLGVVRNIIFASSEGSKRQTLQRIGRVLRKVEGKEQIVLHDIVDNSHHYLKKMSRRRMKLYNDEDFEIEIEF